MLRVVGLVLLSAICRADAEPATLGAAESIPRAGLPNFSAKARNAAPIKVAFLGGSITAAHGWRVLLCNELKRRYPDARFTEIFAAIPGTDSAYGACRLGHDVLSRHPDLLFVEFAVNDIGAKPGRIRGAVEGIVRQTWTQNPDTDICFIYTLDQGQLADYQAGRASATARAMDEIAEHYKIPSIHFGPEVARQIATGQLAFKGPAQELDQAGRNPAGQLVFSTDGTHPSKGGHELYFSIIERALPVLLSARSTSPHLLPAAFSETPWTSATILPVGEFNTAGSWQKLPPKDKRVAWQAAEITPLIWQAKSAGDTATFTFYGDTFGLVGLKGPDSGQFSVTVDDGAPVLTTFFDRYSKEGHYRLATWYYPAPLAKARHVVTIELRPPSIDKSAVLGRPASGEAFEGHFLYLGGALLPQGIQ